MKLPLLGIILVLTVELIDTSFSLPAGAQPLEKIRIAYSGTGTTSYVMEIGQRSGIFRKNGLDPEIIYVGSGSLLMQALIAGTFFAELSQGSEAMEAKLHGADVRIAAVIANHFNHVFLSSRNVASV
ncbi:MAG TPA: hypothetical protein VLX11_01935, partial [Candidatus Acidoferrales bacterium]|nr:hypothetical protein [Candidatus Acidoferrales bacterium]